MSIEKGHEQLVEAFAEVHSVNPKTKLVLIGDGYLRQKIESIVNSKGLNEAVYLLGQKSNPHKYVSRADCFVFSSKHEGQGLVLLEALTLKKPIIATDLPVYHDLVKGSGELVENSKDGLRDGMINFLNNKPALSEFDIYLYQENAITMFHEKVLDDYKKDWTRHTLIAHAGGGIDGKSYTNSEEALRLSYVKGYRLFEIDLTVSKDGEVVARHDWQDDYGQVAFAKPGSPMTHRAFMSSNIYGKYTPMDLMSVVAFMAEFKDTYVIIDVKTKSTDDTEEMYSKISQALEGVDEVILSRLVAQVFFLADLPIVRAHGFRNTLYVPGDAREGYDFERTANFIKNGDIDAASIWHKKATDDSLAILRRKGVKPYLYTLNDTAQMQALREAGAHGFFTDFITPEEVSR